MADRSADSSREVVRAAFIGLLRDGHPGDVDHVPLARLGIDSLDFFDTAMRLEDEHDIVIPVAKLHAELTLAELCDMVDGA